MNGKVIDDGTLDFRVVIDKGNGRVFVNLFDGFQQLAAGLACAVDDDGSHLFAVMIGQNCTQDHTRAGDADHQDQEIDDGQGKVQFLFKNQGGQAEQDR